MALWDQDNLEDLANSSKSQGGQQREYPEGAYHLKLNEFKSETAQAGYAKWIIQWQFIAGETAEQTQKAVGGKKTQHFNTEHPTPDTAKSARADLLFLLKLMGVDVAGLRNAGDLFMIAQELTAKKPVVCMYVKPQEKAPQYLNWYPKGLVKEDGSVIGKDGEVLTQWGQSQDNGSEIPAAVEKSAPASDDLGL
jgi:hypothetical protein